MHKLNEIAAPFAEYYTQKVERALSKEDLIGAFAFGAKWGKAYLWNKIGNDVPSLRNPYKQIAIVVMISHEEFDIDVITAEDFEAYLNRENHKGVPVLWCYLRDLLFKQVKDKAVYGYKKKRDVEEEEYVEFCGGQVFRMGDLESKEIKKKTNINY